MVHGKYNVIITLLICFIVSNVEVQGCAPKPRIPDVTTSLPVELFSESVLPVPTVEPDVPINTAPLVTATLPPPPQSVQEIPGGPVAGPVQSRTTAVSVESNTVVQGVPPPPIVQNVPRATLPPALNFQVTITLAPVPNVQNVPTVELPRTVPVGQNPPSGTLPPAPDQGIQTVRPAPPPSSNVQNVPSVVIRTVQIGPGAPSTSVPTASLAAFAQILASRTAAQDTVTQQTILRDTCAGTGGISVNGRCFYVPTLTYSWTDAWGACRRQGGVLAQIMTSGELNTISAYLMNRFRDPTGSVWIGLRRNSSNSQPVPVSFMPPNSTYWYNNNNEPNDRLSVGNTWIRSRQNDDNESTGNDCIQLWDNYSRFRDAACADRIPPLCQLVNSSLTRDFTLVGDLCLTETTVEELTSTTPMVCSNMCRSRSWCRSYNLLNGLDCHLFPWVSVDRPAMISNQSCQLFEYVA